MKKVCCFCDIWGTGGIENYLLNTLEHMDLRGLEVDLVVARIDSEFYIERVKKLDIGFFSLSGNIRRVFANLYAFWRLIHKKKYDVLYVNAYQSLSLLYTLIAKLAGIPVRIIHSHNSDLRKSTGRTIKLIIHFIAKYSLINGATSFWACSEKAAKFMFPSSVLKNRTWVFIPNGIDLGRFVYNSNARQRVRQEFNLEGRFVVGNIGRLSIQKNQDFLLDVLVSLKEIRPDAVLLLIGEGELRHKLEEKAELLEIRRDVIFIGVTDRIPDLLWAMDVLAFPSFLEGLGIVAIEAQAASLPVVCSSNVPKEVGLSDLVSFLPLNAGKTIWAEELVKCADHGRITDQQLLLDAGYCIDTVSKKVRAAWLHRR